MRIENENFVLVGSLNTLSLVYMTEYNQKPNDTHILVPKTHSQSKILPECWWFYTSAACDACDKYHVWIILIAAFSFAFFIIHFNNETESFDDIFRSFLKVALHPLSFSNPLPHILRFHDEWGAFTSLAPSWGRLPQGSVSYTHLTLPTIYSV